MKSFLHRIKGTCICAGSSIHEFTPTNTHCMYVCICVILGVANLRTAGCKFTGAGCGFTGCGSQFARCTGCGPQVYRMGSGYLQVASYSKCNLQSNEF